MMKKKILLVNPSFPEKTSWFNIPVSLLYLGSWLIHIGYEVRILDALDIKHAASLFEKIRAELPDVLCVGLSVMSAQVPSALEISRFVRQRAPHKPIVWGGVHPTLYPEQTAKSECVDFVIRGDGEITLTELLEAMGRDDFRPEKIAGLAFKTDHNEIILTQERELLDINESPSTDWNVVRGLKPDSSLRETSDLTEYGLPILSSRGCPHRCTFCINSVTKSRYRYRQTDLVLDEIERIAALGVDRFWFVDEDFLANRKRVREFLDGIEKRRLKVKWFMSARADYFRDDYLSSEDLSRLKNCGCEIVGIGAESGSQRILDMLKKDITVEDTLNAAKRLSKVGIKANFSFMIGLPAEKEADYKQTLRLIEEIMKIDDSFLIIGPQIYRPYPGSQVYLECVERGLKEPTSIDEWADSPYIHLEYSRKSYYHKSLYPWVEYSGDLTNLVFYAALAGIRLRWRPIAKLVRLIGSTRCRKFYFRYPVAKEIYGFLRGSWLEKLLRQKGINVS